MNWLKKLWRASGETDSLATIVCLSGSTLIAAGIVLWYAPFPLALGATFVIGILWLGAVAALCRIRG